MNFGDKLAALRRENNYTQEQLADILSVSRQSISKWESNAAYPETDKIIKICQLFGCSTDYLLVDGVSDRGAWAREDDSGADQERENNEETANSATLEIRLPKIKEYKSKKTLWGLPLWHIAKNARGIIAVGLNARGIISIGLRSCGVVSVGVLSMGIISIGTLSLGLLFSLGLFSVALLISVGTIAAGVLTVGAISFGAFSLGAVAIGDYSVGALAIGKYAALGDHARAAIAVGGSKASGGVFSHVGKLNAESVAEIKLLVDQTVPSYLKWAAEIFKSFFI